MSTQSAKQLRDAVRRMMVAYGGLSEAKRPCGTPLSLPNAYALLELLHHSTPMTVAQLAEKLAIDRTNVSRLCQRMEHAGELTRAVHPQDARAKALLLTPHGKELAQNVDESSASYFEQVLEALDGHTDAVVDALHTLETAMVKTKETT